jgi:putative transposase
LYLRLLEYFGRQNGCAVHAYCLMPNHVHLLVTPGSETALALTMKSVTQLYTQHVNKASERTGSLWEGRYRSCLVPTERYVLACYRYIELNPVAAGMVQHAGDYRWSSHRANAEGSRSALIDPHPSFPGPEAYRGLFDDTLEWSVVDDIRRATRGGFALGGVRRKPGRQMRKIGTVPI